MDKSRFLKNYIPNPKERKLVTVTITIVAPLFLIGFLFISYFYQQWLTNNSHAYKGMFKELGSIARIGFFIALSIYPVFLLIKWKPLKKITWRNFQLKTLLQFIGKLIRQWHVPIAIVFASIAILHGYMAILKEFEWDFTYLSGIISMITLLLLMFMGLKRYKRQDKKWHFKLAIFFLIIFMLHATFS